MQRKDRRRKDRGLVRPHHSKFAALYRVLDSAVVLLALAAAAKIDHAPMDYFLWVAGLLAVLGFQIAGDALELYMSWRVYPLRRELSQLTLACMTVGVFLVVLAFLTHTSAQYSRLVMGLWWVFALVCLGLERVAIRTLLRRMRARGHNTRSVAIAGGGDIARQVAARLFRKNSFGLRPVGCFDDDVPVGTRLGQDPALVVQGNLKALVKLAREGGVDFVYIALPLTRQKTITALIWDLSDSMASVFFVPDFFAFEMLQARLTDINGMPVVSVFDTPFLGVDGWLKRIEDVLIATIALIVTAPLMLAIAIGVKLSSPGPVLFRQRRCGLSGKAVQVWKFRTMSVLEDGDDFVQARRADPRVTRFGAFLRRTSLDELPQFFSVLQGHMSVVCPRFARSRAC